MNVNLLKVFAGHIVTVSEMDSDTKLQLLNFLEGASDYQIKTFLLDVEMVKDTTNEFAKSIVDTRFEISALPTKVKQFQESYIEESIPKSILGIALVGPGGWLMYRTIRAAFDEKSKKCGVYGVGRVRDVCLWKARADKHKKLANLLKKAKSNCSKHKDPSACVSKLNAQIAKEKMKYKNQMEKIKQYSIKSPEKQMKAQAGERRAASPETKFF